MNHIAAIHVIKGQLRLTVDDYRALLQQLTGKDSSKDMTDTELLKVRAHLSGLAEKMGVNKPRPQSTNLPTHQQHKPSETTRTGYGRFGTFKLVSAKERKVWAMWHDLGRQGKLDNPSGNALQAWVKRQTDVDQLRFCSDAQMNGLIESLKLWAGREISQDKATGKKEA
jgi:phage gp16-like protein